LTHKSATWAKRCVTRAVTLPIGLQSWPHTFAHEPEERPLSGHQGPRVSCIVLCLYDVTPDIFCKTMSPIVSAEGSRSRRKRSIPSHLCTLCDKFTANLWFQFCKPMGKVTRAKWRRYASHANSMCLLRPSASAASSLVLSPLPKPRHDLPDRCGAAVERLPDGL
jgi:hypothetical protein